MFVRQLKLTTNVGMAAVAELRLHFCEKILWGGWFVNGMAGITSNPVHRVGRTPDVTARETFGMAAEANVQALWGGHLRKRSDSRLASMRSDV